MHHDHGCGVSYDTRIHEDTNDTNDEQNDKYARRPSLDVYIFDRVTLESVQF